MGTVVMISKKHQTGFVLIYAIFIVVVIGSAVAFMMRLNATQASSTSLSLLGARAYMAAQAGLEWGMYQVNSLSACPAPVSNFDLTQGSLAGFSISVFCIANTPLDEGGTPVNLINLTVRSERGVYGTDVNYVSRTLSASVAL